MDVYAFRETPMDCITSITPCKKKRASCLMRDEIAISTSACNEFKREMAVMKLKFPFLTESQIQGRTMDKFGIPNILGRPYKLQSGSLRYSTVNHILYLIKRTISEKKRYRKNSAVRRHTISGAYVPIEIITTKCDLRRNRKSKKNLEKKFSLYSEENDLSDDDYNIESSGEYSRGRYSDILSISEFGYSYQSDGDEGPYKIRKTYERKSLDKFTTNSYFEKNKKRVSLTDDTNSKKSASDQSVEISKDTASKIDSVDRNSKENDMEIGKQRENDNFNDTENQKEEANHTSGINSFDLSNSYVNKTKENSIKSKDSSKGGSHDCKHEVVTKKSTSSSRNLQKNSVARKRTNSEAKDSLSKQNSDELENTSDEEMDEIQIIYEKVEVMGVVKVKKEDDCNKIKHLQEKETVPETSSVLENSQKISSNSKFKTKYIKQSISVCSGEYLWQDGSESSIESSIKSDSQSTHKYFQRFQRQKISLPFSQMDGSDKMASSQSNTLGDYKSRKNYLRKTSECIILVDLESKTDSEHNTSVDELSMKSGENSEENKSRVISYPHDLASENSNDSISDTSDSASSELDDSLKVDGTTGLNVAFSPHFATQNTLSYYSNESLTSQETEIDALNCQRSERSITNELDDDGYYLANLFDDDDNPSTRQRTLRSTSVRENYSGDDEPTFVD